MVGEIRVIAHVYLTIIESRWFPRRKRGQWGSKNWLF